MFKVVDAQRLTKDELINSVFSGIMEEFRNDPDVTVERNGDTLVFLKKDVAAEKQLEYGRVVMLGGRIDMLEMSDKAIIDRIEKSLLS